MRVESNLPEFQQHDYDSGHVRILLSSIRTSRHDPFYLVRIISISLTRSMLHLRKSFNPSCLSMTDVTFAGELGADLGAGLATYGDARRENDTCREETCWAKGSEDEEIGALRYNTDPEAVKFQGMREY